MESLLIIVVIDAFMDLMFQIILNMLRYESVLVLRRMLQRDIMKYGVKEFPSMFEVQREGGFKLLAGWVDLGYILGLDTNRKSDHSQTVNMIKAHNSGPSFL